MSARSKPAGLVRRPSRATPVLLLALVVLIIGGAGVWLLGTYLFTDAWPSAADGPVGSTGEMAFESVAVKIASVVLAVVGVALLLAALVPGRSSRVLVLDNAIPGHTALSRRDLSRRIERRAEKVDGVHSVRAEVGKRRIDVAVHTVVDDTAPVQRSATAAVERAVEELRPAGGLHPRVRVHRRS